MSLHKINVMKPPEECRLQSQKMTGKREIEREREVWCEKTKAEGKTGGRGRIEGREKGGKEKKAMEER